MNDIDLALLTPPEIIKAYEYEAILSQTKTKLIEAFDKHGVAYDVEDLETDPAMIVAQAKAYDELGLYIRTNDVARSRLVFFAQSTDLDHVVSPWVVRMEGEQDDRLKERYILTIWGRSEERYMAAAMKAHIDVEAVSVYRLGSGPELEVAILSAVNDGVADQSLLGTVTAEINTISGRSINDVFEAVSAVKKFADITANVWLLPGADQAILDLLEQHVKDAWNALSVMGLDLVPSWVSKELHRVGVQRVELIGFDDSIVASNKEAIAINSVTINPMGRDR